MHSGELSAPEGVLQLCVDYAEAGPDDDLDTCLIEAALTGNMPPDLRTGALDLLVDRDEPRLDYLKLARRSLLRYARLIEACCALDRGERACDPGNPFRGRVENTRDIAGTDRLCIEVATAPIEDLLLDPVLPERLSQWSPETASGMPAAQ